MYDIRNVMLIVYHHLHNNNCMRKNDRQMTQATASVPSIWGRKEKFNPFN